MKFSLVLISGVIATTFEDVYGKVATPTEYAAWAQKTRRRARTFQRFSESCVSTLQLAVLQETTASFGSDFSEVQSLTAHWSNLTQEYSDTSVGVISFRDKPLSPYGSADDYCARIEQPLSHTLNHTTLFAAGGGDAPGSQLTAIVAAADSSLLGWSGSAVRFILLITDAAAHFAADGENTLGLTPYSGAFDERSQDLQCVEEYYPSPHQVKQALEKRQAYLAVVVRHNNPDSQSQKTTLSSWKWLNNYLGQPPAFVMSSGAEHDDVWNALQEVLASARDIECRETPTLPPDYTIIPAPIQTLPNEATDEMSQSVNESYESCGCGKAVEIRLRDRPSHLRLDITN